MLFTISVSCLNLYGMFSRRKVQHFRISHFLPRSFVDPVFHYIILAAHKEVYYNLGGGSLVVLVQRFLAQPSLFDCVLNLILQVCMYRQDQHIVKIFQQVENSLSVASTKTTSVSFVITKKRRSLRTALFRLDDFPLNSARPIFQ